ncbi:uncharacterized protein LOC120354351 [Nilaparvata lugens]|uniref:uncharacterized protein LOC120354351 n=1 Tax=Nilaparvata lugens TaxID=108931 RepID=UPI00193DA232|nr:uncharacterized protein LOC120354351 [Nilaparvata lugens]
MFGRRKFFSFLLCSMILGSFGALKVGDYDLRLDHIDYCDRNVKQRFLSNMRVEKLNRTHFTYSGFVDTLVDIDENTKVRAHVLLKQTNGRFSTVIDVKYKACDILSTFTLEIMESVFEHCNTTFECPMKRWTCEMKKWIVNVNFQNIPALPYGDYRLDWYGLRRLSLAKEETLFCIRIYGSVHPKYKHRPQGNISKNYNVTALMSQI